VWLIQYDEHLEPSPSGFFSPYTAGQGCLANESMKVPQVKATVTATFTNPAHGVWSRLNKGRATTKKCAVPEL
jgi:hypothetical protein